LHLCLLCIVKKFDLIRTKLTEEIHYEVCPYHHNTSMDATPPSNAMRPPVLRCKHQRAAACPQHSERPHLLLARYDIGTLQTGTFKNSTLGMFINLEWSTFGNSGSGHVRNSELGTTFGGHLDLGAQSGREKTTGLPTCLFLKLLTEVHYAAMTSV